MIKYFLLLRAAIKGIEITQELRQAYLEAKKETSDGGAEITTKEIQQMAMVVLAELAQLFDDHELAKKATQLGDPAEQVIHNSQAEQATKTGS